MLHVASLPSRCRALLLLLTFALAAVFQRSAALPPVPAPVPIWNGSVPGVLGAADELTSPGKKLKTVHVPAVYPFVLKDAGAPTAAVVICPGGGYQHVAMEKEGYTVARWLNERGIAAFVLKYRYAPYKYPVPLQDAEQAVRWVRGHAREYNLDRDRIGIWGFSAGGHLASMVLDNLDGADIREVASSDSKNGLDFAILGYPVIVLNDEALVHKGSRTNLLGKDYTPAQADAASTDQHVIKRKAPVFIFHAKDDKTVPVANGERMHAALQKVGNDSTLKRVETGGHGFGLKSAEVDAALSAWLIEKKIADPEKAKVADEKPLVHVFIAGDSTACDYVEKDAPRMGWGQVLPEFFDAKQVQVINVAQSGRSSRSFIKEGWLTEIEQRILPGDYLLIQFGHNDEKTDDRHTDPQTSFPLMLKKYIAVAQRSKATPVLITPVERRKFKDGKLQATHDGYPDAIRKLAVESHAALVDLTALSHEAFEKAGDDATKQWFLYLPENTPNYPQGAHDDTHFQKAGAEKIAQLVVLGLKDCGVQLAKLAHNKGEAK